MDGETALASTVWPSDKESVWGVCSSDSELARGPV
jgi:hypothetical protein